jgi:hypothetical protein
MKLITAKDFVLKQDVLPVTSKSVKEDFCPINKLNRIINYAKFLNKPLTHSMFYPSDDNGEMLVEPERVYFNTDFDFKAELSVYNEAKAIVLFDGLKLCELGKNNFILDYDGQDIWITKGELVEDLLGFDGLEFELTKYAVKTLGCEAII